MNCQHLAESTGINSPSEHRQRPHLCGCEHPPLSPFMTQPLQAPATPTPAPGSEKDRASCPPPVGNIPWAQCGASWWRGREAPGSAPPPASPLIVIQTSYIMAMLWGRFAKEWAVVGGLLWDELYLSKFICKVLTPRTSECHRIWTFGL